MSDIVVTAAARRSVWPLRSDATGRRARAQAASMKLAVISCMDGVSLCVSIATALSVLQGPSGFRTHPKTILIVHAGVESAPVRLKPALTQGCSSRED